MASLICDEDLDLINTVINDERSHVCKHSIELHGILQL